MCLFWAQRGLADRRSGTESAKHQPDLISDAGCQTRQSDGFLTGRTIFIYDQCLWCLVELTWHYTTTASTLRRKILREPTIPSFWLVSNSLAFSSETSVAEGNRGCYVNVLSAELKSSWLGYDDISFRNFPRARQMFRLFSIRCSLFNSQTDFATSLPLASAPWGHDVKVGRKKQSNEDFYCDNNFLPQNESLSQNVERFYLPFSYESDINATTVLLLRVW